MAEGVLKAAMAAALNRFVDEYRINWIVACPDTPAKGDATAMVPLDEALRERIGRSRTERIVHSLTFSEQGYEGFAMLHEGEVSSVAHFADYAAYRRATTWQLGTDEVALMDIATEDAMRGRGHAARLIMAGEKHYKAMGKARLIAFIWWSNTPSLKTFRKAGWHRIALSLEWRRGDKWSHLHLPLGLPT